MKRILTATFIAFTCVLNLLCIVPSVKAQTSTSVTIASGSPVSIVSFNAGDKVDIVARLDTTDVNENGEGEPLVLQSSTGFSGVVSAYAQPTTFSFTAPAAGTLSGFIQGFDSDESATVTVTLNSTQKKRFTQEQKDAMARASADLNVQAADYTTVAVACLLIPDPTITKICAFSGGALAGVTWMLSARLNRLALDPSDPNFTVIAQPVVPSLPLLTVQPGVTQAEADALNALLINEEQAIAFAEAAAISIDRAQGAFDAGNTFWEDQQVQAANMYIGQLAALLNAQPTLLANAQNALIAGGFPTVPISASTVLNVEFSALFNGLPTDLLQALTDLGADSATIDQIRSLLTVQDINAVAGNFPQLLTRPQLINSLQQLVQTLVVPVTIDIKPGTSVNAINVGSSGKIPVAILSTPTFNAITSVNLTSLTFGRTGSEHSLAFCNQNGQDVNGDGLPDLVCHFTTKLTGFQQSSTEGVLGGSTVNNVPIHGSDSVTIVR